VELALDDPQTILPAIRHAGAIFLGHHTPEAIGDYVGGSNHVLPTARSARFASGLGVLDFMKRTSLLGCTPSSLSALAEAAVTIAGVEDLDGHGRSISIRLNR
jgi:histidinol dehydrogenase